MTSDNPIFYNQGIKNYGISKIIKLVPESQSHEKNTKKIIYEKSPSFSQAVVKISFTNHNVFILLSNGELYSRGNFDCLGRKTNNNLNEDKFEEIIFHKNYNYYSLNREPEKKIIHNISAGNEHVICVDNENNLWGWGDNTFHQVNPKNEEKRIEYPIIINFPKNNLKIFHIITPRNSTIIISERNRICSWGEINRKSFSSNGHHSNSHNKNDNSMDFLTYDDTINLINDSMFKDTSDYRDAFIRARQLIYKGYSFNGGEGDDIKLRKAALNAKIKQLKLEIEDKEKESKIKMNNLGLMRDKKFNDLRRLINDYEEKIEKITYRKEEYRTQLAKLDNEITSENKDIKSNNKLLDNVEEDIEELYNELERANDRIESLNYDDKNIKKENENDYEQMQIQEKEIESYDKQRKIKNKEILKDNLNKNLDVICKTLEDKEKERNTILYNLSTISEVENEYIDIRNTLDEMIKVLYEMKGTQKVTDEFNSMHNKVKDTYDKFIDYNKNLDSITIVKLNEKEPYKTIIDLLNESNKQLKVIDDGVTQFHLGNQKNDLKIIYEMINAKIQLISEQNKMVYIIYIMLSSLKDSDIRQYFQEKLKGKNEIEEQINFENNIEFIYKNIIINLLRETYMKINEVDLLQNVTSEIPNKIKMDYIKKKMEEEKKIKSRDPPINTNDNFNLYNDMKTFNFNNQAEGSNKQTKSINTLKSTWSWSSGFTNDKELSSPNLIIDNQ